MEVTATFHQTGRHTNYSSLASYSIEGAPAIQEFAGTRRFLPDTLVIEDDGAMVTKVSVTGLHLKKDGTPGARRCGHQWSNYGIPDRDLGAPGWLQPILAEHIAHYALTPDVLAAIRGGDK